MKIALISENSQAAKNELIEGILKKAAEPKGHQVVNYGMYGAEDPASINYIQCGILAAILLNSGAADFVVTGCGNGEGAMLGLNSFPGVTCGHLEDPVDAYSFAQTNAGNAVSFPFAKGWGLGGELNLEACFEMLFRTEHGRGYPEARGQLQKAARECLDSVRAVTFRPLLDCLKDLDPALVKGAIAGPRFRELFFADCKDETLAAYLKTLL